MTEPMPRGPLFVALAIGLIVGIAGAVVVTLALTSEPGAERATPSKAVVTIGADFSPEPTPEGDSPESIVQRTFASQEWVKGDKRWLGVSSLNLVNADCAVHAFRDGGEVLGAYRAGCTSWETTGKGYDVLVFWVGIRNRSDRPMRFDLRNFVLTARDTRTYGPVNVRSLAGAPPDFLPEAQKVPPKSNLVGYLTFDGRATRLVPHKLSYIDGGQTLIVVFEGKHVVRP